MLCTTAWECTPALQPGIEAVGCMVYSLLQCGDYLSCEYDEKTHYHYGIVSSILEIVVRKSM